MEGPTNTAAKQLQLFWSPCASAASAYTRLAASFVLSSSCVPSLGPGMHAVCRLSSYIANQLESTYARKVSPSRPARVAHPRSRSARVRRLLRQTRSWACSIRPTREICKRKPCENPSPFRKGAKIVPKSSLLWAKKRHTFFPRSFLTTTCHASRSAALLGTKVRPNPWSPVHLLREKSSYALAYT